MPLRDISTEKWRIGYGDLRQGTAWTGSKKEYLNLFEAGEYKPELLFSNDKILENIAEHPMAIWKACSQEKYRNEILIWK